MEKVLERLNKAPATVRFGGLAAIIVLIIGATYYFSIMDLQTDIESLGQQQAQKDQVLAEKQEIANNLNQRRIEMEKLKQQLDEALTELPLDKDIDELLAQLNDLGKKSGLEISKVTPGTEAAEGFYARIPVSMSVSGNYHEIASFLQEVANMRRIVNVNNIKLTTPTARGDKVVLRSDFMATTFRFVNDKPGGK